jgi:hypothetical protein
MRRIIERKVIVVTTTTWRIYWADEAPQTNPKTAPDTDSEPKIPLIEPGQHSREKDKNSFGKGGRRIEERIGE